MDQAYPGRTAKKNYQNHLANIINPADAYRRDKLEVIKAKELDAKMYKVYEANAAEEEEEKKHTPALDVLQPLSTHEPLPNLSQSLAPAPDIPQPLSTPGPSVNLV